MTAVIYVFLIRTKAIPMETELTQQQILSYDKYLAHLVKHGRVVEIHAFLEKNPNACQILMTPVQRGHSPCSLLMLAAHSGHDAVVRLILERSSVNRSAIEQGVSATLDGGRWVENVTPLWLALSRGHYHVARTLIDLGNARIDHGPAGHLPFSTKKHTVGSFP